MIPICLHLAIFPSKQEYLRYNKCYLNILNLMFEVSFGGLEDSALVSCYA